MRDNVLHHGCARVAHCVNARWRNFSHYCRPLRQYDVWFTCSEHREALPGAPTAHGNTQTRVYSARGKHIVRHWTTREASLRHSSGWGTWSVSPQYSDLRTRVLHTAVDWQSIVGNGCTNSSNNPFSCPQSWQLWNSQSLCDSSVANPCIFLVRPILCPQNTSP